MAKTALTIRKRRRRGGQRLQMPPTLLGLADEMIE
jgi:hypothetical protein